jgi:hypothetical protein
MPLAGRLVMLGTGWTIYVLPIQDPAVGLTCVAIRMGI